MAHGHIAPIGIAPAGTHRPAFTDRWLAAQAERMLDTVDVRLQLWDGRSSWTSAHRPIGTLVIGDRRALMGLIVNPELWFGEAYMTGRIQVQGELEPVLEALYRLWSPVPSWWDRARAHLAPPITLSHARRRGFRCCERRCGSDG